MKLNSIELEQKALGLLNEGRAADAVSLLLQVIEQDPDYEHGILFYDLAGCYEDLGEIEKAEQCYLRALSYSPADPIRLGGYASFLYLHGDPNRALKVYLDLLRIERSSGRDKDAESTMIAIKELGRRIGLSEEIVMGAIESP